MYKSLMCVNPCIYVYVFMSVCVCVFACSMETCSVLAFDYKDTNISRNLHNLFPIFIFVERHNPNLIPMCVMNNAHHWYREKICIQSRKKNQNKNEEYRRNESGKIYTQPENCTLWVEYVFFSRASMKMCEWASVRVSENLLVVR